MDDQRANREGERGILGNEQTERSFLSRVGLAMAITCCVLFAGNFFVEQLLPRRLALYYTFLAPAFSLVTVVANLAIGFSSKSSGIAALVIGILVLTVSSWYAFMAWGFRQNKRCQEPNPKMVPDTLFPSTLFPRVAPTFGRGNRREVAKSMRPKVGATRDCIELGRPQHRAQPTPATRTPLAA